MNQNENMTSLEFFFPLILAILIICSISGILTFVFFLILYSKSIMANFENFELLLQRIDEATNTTAEKLNEVALSTENIAEDIRLIKEDLSAGGLTPTQEADIQSRLEALAGTIESNAQTLTVAATRLNEIAADTEDPVPDDPTEG